MTIDAQQPAQAGEPVEGGAVPAAPPVSVTGILGEGNVLLGEDGVTPIGTWQILRTWTIPKKGGRPMGRVGADVGGVAYVNIVPDPKVGARFKGLTPGEISRRSAESYKRNQAVTAAASVVQQALGDPDGVRFDFKPRMPVEDVQHAAAPKRAAPLPDPDFAQVVTLEEAVRRIRRAVVDTLRAADPGRGYEEYKLAKYDGTDDPTLTQRRRAYVVAFERLLAIGYHEPNA